MSFLGFLRENARWLSGGFLLTLFSGFGQTFFISLSAGEIRAEFGLSHGGWGSVYMLATLGSALCLPWVGAVVDHRPIWQVSLGTTIFLSLACIGMALAGNVFVLVIVIFALRLFGQGMMTHIALTAMGKWYATQRGRAVSVTSIGVNAGEACLPIAFVLISSAIGWRGSWLLGAGVILLVAMPAICALMSRERTPRGSDPKGPLIQSRNWTRAEVLRDPLLYILLLGVLAPPFIGTTIFFQQVHLVEIRGWSLETFAASYLLMAVSVIIFALIAGHLVDRFSAVQLLPSFLLPMAAACIVLATVPHIWSAYVFMALLGVSYGFSSTLLGALWPELYGTKYLGGVRSMIVSTMVFATAAGPGITGYLIDFGVAYPTQVLFMGIYCLAAAVLMVFASRAAQNRNQEAAIPI